jgi:hypothetical protein
MVRSALFGAAALALTVTGAAAEDRNSANYIMQGCRDVVTGKRAPLTVTDSARCMGIIEGISFMGGMVKLGLEFGPMPDPRWQGLVCLDIPDGVTTGQMVRVVVAYIDAQLARMHEEFNLLALEALRDAWPCK